MVTLQLTLTPEWRPDGEQGLLVPFVLNIHMVLPEWGCLYSHMQTTLTPKWPPALLPLLQRHTHTPWLVMWHGTPAAAAAAAAF